MVILHEDVRFDPEKWDDYFNQVSAKQRGKALRHKNVVGYTHYESGRRKDRIWWRVVFRGSPAALDIEDKYLISHKELLAKEKSNRPKMKKRKQKKETTNDSAKDLDYVPIGDEFDELRQSMSKKLSGIYSRRESSGESPLPDVEPPSFDSSPSMSPPGLTNTTSEEEIFNRERVESAMENITQHEGDRMMWLMKLLGGNPSPNQLDVAEFLWELGHFQGFCDADGDGYITQAEFEKANVGEQAIKSLFASADATDIDEEDRSLNILEIGTHALKWVKKEMKDTERKFHAAAGYLDVFRRTFSRGSRLPGWFDCEPQKMIHLKKDLKEINITGSLHWARSVAFVVSLLVNLTFITISLTQIPDRDSSQAFNLTERIIRIMEFVGVWFLFLWAVADLVRYKYQVQPCCDYLREWRQDIEDDIQDNAPSSETLFARGFKKLFLVSKFSVMRMVIFANPPRLFENETEFIKNSLTKLFFRYHLSDRMWAIITCCSNTPQVPDAMDTDIAQRTTAFWSTFLFDSKLIAAILGISGMLLKVLAFKDLDDSEMWNWDFKHFFSFFGFVVQVAGLSNLDHFPYIPPQVNCYRLKWAAEDELCEALAENKKASKFWSQNKDSTAKENKFQWSHIFWRLLFVGGVSKKTMMDLFYRRDLKIGINDRLSHATLATVRELRERIHKRSFGNVVEEANKADKEINENAI